MNYPIITRHEQYNRSVLNQTAIQSAIVVAQQPGTNTIQVRLPGAGDRVLSRVLIPYGQTFQSGDHVIIVKNPTEIWWSAICRIQEPDQYGLYGSSATQENSLHKPGEFSVWAADHLLIAQWEPWTGAAHCYQVQFDDWENPTVSDINTFFTYGSYFLYQPSEPDTYYVRVRSMRYEVAEDKAFYGSWTDWDSATTVGIATQAEIDALESTVLAHIEEQEWMWALHLTGEE